MPILHAALNVSDADESVEFYRDVFGMEVRNEMEGDGLRQVWVGRGEEFDMQFREVEDEPIGPSGVDHIAIEVEDVDATAATFDDEDVLRGPEDVGSMGIRIAFVTDPDGYVIELIEGDD